MPHAHLPLKPLTQYVAKGPLSNSLELRSLGGMRVRWVGVSSVNYSLLSHFMME